MEWIRCYSDRNVGKMLRLTKLSQYKFRFKKKTIKTNVFRTTAKKRMVTGNNFRKLIIKHIVICFDFSYYFFHNISNCKQKWVRHGKCILFFMKSYIYSCHILWNLNFLARFLKKIQMSNFIINRPFGSQVVPCAQTYGRADRQTWPANSHFSQFCEDAEKNWWVGESTFTHKEIFQDFYFLLRTSCVAKATTVLHLSIHLQFSYTTVTSPDFAVYGRWGGIQQKPLNVQSSLINLIMSGPSRDICCADSKSFLWQL